jgi:hypothetical protein
MASPFEKFMESQNRIVSGRELAAFVWDAALEEAMKLGEDVAEQVGGKFWETHMLNTGLLKFLNRLRELKEQK